MDTVAGGDGRGCSNIGWEGGNREFCWSCASVVRALCECCAGVVLVSRGRSANVVRASCDLRLFCKCCASKRTRNISNAREKHNRTRKTHAQENQSRSTQTHETHERRNKHTHENNNCTRKRTRTIPTHARQQQIHENQAHEVETAHETKTTRDATKQRTRKTHVIKHTTEKHARTKHDMGQTHRLRVSRRFRFGGGFDNCLVCSRVSFWFGFVASLLQVWVIHEFI